eukprot:2784878-Amphidinium_carterae.1
MVLNQSRLIDDATKTEAQTPARQAIQARPPTAKTRHPRNPKGPPVSVLPEKEALGLFFLGPKDSAPTPRVAGPSCHFVEHLLQQHAHLARHVGAAV